MVKTTRSKSVSAIHSDSTKTRGKLKIQDGRQDNGGSSKQSDSPVAVRSKHSPKMNSSTSGSRILPDIPDISRTPKTMGSEIGDDRQPMCAVLECNKPVIDSENAVCCDKCYRWVHQQCANFNQTEYKLLTKKGKNQDNLMWFCGACTPLVRCLLRGKPQSPSHSPMLQGELNKKLDRLIEGFTRMEAALCKKEERMEDIIEDKVNKYLSEQKERSNRDQNVIFHNIPESDSTDVNERKNHDIEQVQEVLTLLDVDDSEVKQPVRLGKKGNVPGKPRLLKVTLNRVETKKETLNKAKKLRTATQSQYNKVYITPDLTYREREESRRLREELAERRAKGEKDVFIRQGKLVKGNTAFRGRSENLPDKGRASDQEEV